MMYKRALSVLIILVLAICVCMSGCTQQASQAKASQSAETTPISGSPASTETVAQQTVASEKPVYIVGVDGEYPPYSFIDKDGSVTGFDVESIRWIANQSGFEVKIQPIAWDGIIPALTAKKIDMVYSGMTITEERKQQVNFSKPYWKVNQSVATQNDNNLIMDDFKAGKGRIGAQRGTTGAFWVEENLINKSVITPDKLVTYDNFPLVATDLQNKRIDFAIYDRPPMLDAIAEKPLHIIGEIDTGEEYGVAIRKEDTELLNMLNNGLDLLMSSPTWEELKTKYEMK